MTVTDLAGDQLAGTTIDAGRAASATLPATTGWQVERCDEASPAPLPDAGTVVVISVGESGRIVLIASAALARAVQVGPPPADDAVSGLEPALVAAASAVADDLGAPLTSGGARAGGPADVEAGPGEVARAVMLLDGDDHAATLVVVVPGPSAAPVPQAVGHQFPDIGATGPTRIGGGPLELLQDVEMGVTAELGRTRMLVREILDLSPGSVIELDRSAGSPVDVLVNGTLIARGEVVVIDEEFGIRVTEVIGYDAGPGRPRT